MSTRCAHQLCHCEVPADRLAQGAEHCSDSCAALGVTGAADERRCDCGHGACASAHTSQPHHQEAVTAIGPQYPEGGGS